VLDVDVAGVVFPNPVKLPNAVLFPSSLYNINKVTFFHNNFALVLTWTDDIGFLRLATFIILFLIASSDAFLKVPASSGSSCLSQLS
jgi:hypothetical protein